MVNLRRKNILEHDGMTLSFQIIMKSFPGM